MGGIGIGLVSNLSLAYIAEVSPTSMRVRFISLNQLTIVIGILAAQLLVMQCLRLQLYGSFHLIFSNKNRGGAMAVAIVALWMASFLLSYSFPFLNKLFNASGTFWLYGLISVMGFLFIWKNFWKLKGKHWKRSKMI